MNYLAVIQKIDGTLENLKLIIIMSIVFIILLVALTLYRNKK